MRPREGSVSRDGVAMDTYVTASIVLTEGIDQGTADEALDDLFGLLADLTDEMDIRPSTGSPLAALNASRTGTVMELTDDLYRAIEYAIEMSEISGGAYDPTVGAITRAWRPEGGTSFRVPDDDELASAAASVGASGVSLTPPNKAAITRRGLKIDLGGIAKGYAASRALSMLRSRGISSALIDMGGSIAVIGERPGGGEWRIGIQDPDAARGAPIALLGVRNTCVITAGLYERRWEEEGKSYSHIYDPSSGRPLAGPLESVTVVCDDPVVGDAMSTAFMVLGPSASAELMRSLPSVEAVFITRSGSAFEIAATEGLRGVISIKRRDCPLSFIRR